MNRLRQHIDHFADITGHASTAGHQALSPVAIAMTPAAGHRRQF